MDDNTTPPFWLPEDVSIDFHRHIYICALCGTGKTLFPFGYDLADGRFWFHDAHGVRFYGAYIQTASGFEPYRVILGGVEYSGHASFIDAYWGLHAVHNAVMLEERHLQLYGRPHSDRCDACDDGL